MPSLASRISLSLATFHNTHLNFKHPKAKPQPLKSSAAFEEPPKETIPPNPSSAPGPTTPSQPTPPSPNPPQSTRTTTPSSSDSSSTESIKRRIKRYYIRKDTATRNQNRKSKSKSKDKSKDKSKLKDKSNKHPHKPLPPDAQPAKSALKPPTPAPTPTPPPKKPHIWQSILRHTSRKDRTDTGSVVRHLAAAAWPNENKLPNSASAAAGAAALGRENERKMRGENMGEPLKMVDTAEYAKRTRFSDEEMRKKKKGHNGNGPCTAVTRVIVHTVTLGAA
ncbi:hypothetical protein EJ06DRAFT_557111 [Trichodelitschia bisporula]|uniref:Uncharacterized protein n=1 Tax=Trichodelitschia bisporula TaxID=703511 RepID=A0A6G1HVU9_9PEZI|nr:hypothetical protein EJ06DRAFT_557111 [Trichodelitschia bisporula]